MMTNTHARSDNYIFFLKFLVLGLCYCFCFFLCLSLGALKRDLPRGEVHEGSGQPAHNVAGLPVRDLARKESDSGNQVGLRIVLSK